jgi:hypothetical protein
MGWTESITRQIQTIPAQTQENVSRYIIVNVASTFFAPLELRIALSVLRGFVDGDVYAKSCNIVYSNSWWKMVLMVAVFGFGHILGPICLGRASVAGSAVTGWMGHWVLWVTSFPPFKLIAMVHTHITCPLCTWASVVLNYTMWPWVRLWWYGVVLTTQWFIQLVAIPVVLPYITHVCAEKARRFRLALSYKQVNKYWEEMRSLKKKLETSSGLVVLRESEMKFLEGKHQRALDVKDGEVSEAKKQLEHANAANVKLNAEIARLTRQCESYRATLERHKAEPATVALDKAIKKHDAEVEGLKDQIRSLEARRTESERMHEASMERMQKELKQKDGFLKEKDQLLRKLKEEGQKPKQDWTTADPKPAYLNHCDKLLLLNLTRSPDFDKSIKAYMKLEVQQLHLFQSVMATVEPATVEQCILHTFGKGGMLLSTIATCIIEPELLKRRLRVELTNRNLKTVLLTIHPDKLSELPGWMRLLRECIFKAFQAAR